MYAIVRAGGRQEKVAVGDVLELDRVSGEAGDVADPARPPARRRRAPSPATPTTLAGVTVTAEVVEHTKGPKIRILQVQEQDRLPQAPGSPLSS